MIKKLRKSLMIILYCECYDVKISVHSYMNTNDIGTSKRTVVLYDKIGIYS